KHRRAARRGRGAERGAATPPWNPGSRGGSSYFWSQRANRETGLCFACGRGIAESKGATAACPSRSTRRCGAGAMSAQSRPGPAPLRREGMSAESSARASTPPRRDSAIHLKRRTTEARAAVGDARQTPPARVRPLRYACVVQSAQQELPFPTWGGARPGAGRKRVSSRPNVPHRSRKKFRKGTLHVTLRLRREVWDLRTYRCFRALKHAFARGCERFGYRLIHFSVQGNHIHTIHMIVEAPDVVSLGRAMKGLEVRMARALNKV